MNNMMGFFPTEMTLPLAALGRTEIFWIGLI
jgi:hypothetical protein